MHDPIKKIYLVTGGVLATDKEYGTLEEILQYPVVAFDNCARAIQYCTDTGYQPKGDIFLKENVYRKVVAVAYYPNREEPDNERKK